MKEFKHSIEIKISLNDYDMAGYSGAGDTPKEALESLEAMKKAYPPLKAKEYALKVRTKIDTLKQKLNKDDW